MMSNCRRFCQSCQGEDRAWQLRNQLAKNYDNATANPNSTITRMVRIESVRLNRIESDEVKQVVRLFARMVLSWNDSKVTWNKQEWGILGSIYIGYSYGPHSSFNSMPFAMQISMRVFANGLALFLTCFTTACFLLDQDTRLTPSDQLCHVAVIGSIVLIHYGTGSFAFLRWFIVLTAIVLLIHQKSGDIEGLRVTIIFLVLESYNRYSSQAPPEQSNDGRRANKKRKSQAKNTIDDLKKELKNQKNETGKLLLMFVLMTLAAIYFYFYITSAKANWKATIDTAYEEFHVGNEMSKNMREFAQTSLTDIRKNHNEDWAQRLQQKMNKKFPPAGWLCVMGTDHSTLQSFSSHVNSQHLYMFGIVKKVFVLFKMT